MRVRLCGKVVLAGAEGAPVDVGRPQVQLCLAVLVLERHRAVARDELAHLLWGDELSPHWKGALRGVLARVRAALDDVGLGAEALSSTANLVQLRLPDDVEVDVEVARLLVKEAEGALTGGRFEQAASDADEAARLLQAGFLPAVDRPWADARRLELAQLLRSARRLAGRALLEVDPAAAVTMLRTVLVDDPFDEETVAVLLAALVAAGDRAGAAAAYDEFVAALQAELGVAPSPELALMGDRVTGRARRGDAGELAASPVRPLPLAPREHREAPARTPFVGREEHLVDLLDRLGRARDGAGLQISVLEGEPGVGKTRLAREVALAHALVGGGVFWGRCSIHGEIPFEPVVAALQRALEERPEVAAEVSARHPALAALVPGLSAAGPGRAPDRARTFAAVVAAVRRLADRPLLWVVDDLQWATPDTLALLEHLALALVDAPVLLLATCRERPAAVASVLEALGRHGSLEAVRLGGVSEEAVARWMGEAGLVADPDTVAEVCRRTGGNPLFVGHLVSAAVSAGGELDADRLPPALAGLLAQRLDALPSDDQLVLSSVAVVGRLASLAVVAEVSGLDGPALLAATDRVCAAGLLEEDEHVLRFGHALVADAVLEHLGPARRAWFHARAAAVLEARGPQRGLAAELALHHAAAGPDHRPQARRWALAAASEALDQVAWATAADLARFVLDEPAADPDERAGALVSLGRALRATGATADADAALHEAVALSRLHHLPCRMAEATLALVGGGGRGVADPARLRWVPLLEDALAGLDEATSGASKSEGGDDTDDLRAGLLGALAVALLLTDRDDERRRCGQAALDAARRSGDRALVARALLDHRYCLGVEDRQLRDAELEEARALAEVASLPEVTSAALLYRYEDLLTAGRREEAAVAMEEAAAHIARHPDAYWSWAVRSWRVVELLLDDELDEAEVAAAAAAGAAPDPAVGVACFGVNLVAVRAYQGRVGEMVPMLRQATDDNPFIPCYRSVLAFALAESGQVAAAADELAWFAADGFRSVRADTNRPLTLAMLSEVAVQLADADAAAALWPLVEPYAGDHVVLNCYGGGGTVWGPASAQLAGLARVLGRDAEADTWAERAVEECRRTGDRAFARRLGVALTELEGRH